MKFTPFPTLTTARLILRKPVKRDGNEVLYLRSDPDVNQYIDRPIAKNLKDAEAFLEKIWLGILKGENINWNITLKENPKMIGSICLWNFSKDQKVAEVGYDLFPKYQNQGIMSEALKCVLNFGFQKLKLEAIEAYTNRLNEPSKKLLLKNDFKVVEDKSDQENPYNVVFIKKNTL